MINWGKPRKPDRKLSGFRYTQMGCLSAANAVQHFTVLGHGLGQVLQNNVLHNINTSIIGWVMVKMIFLNLKLARALAAALSVKVL